jgi:hypothetical protein
MIVECKNCGVMFEKKPKDIKKSPNHFHNKSCATTYNNKKAPKRKKKKYYCKVCGVEISYKRSMCDEHRFRKSDWSNRTIDDILTKSNRPQDTYMRVREHARRVYKRQARPNCCERCNYTHHFQICHIKPIYEFDLNTPITVVNDPSNLMALCPNCHWELDNGLWRP